MGEAFITRRGGGIPYAVIGVTYPEGSICTCTNGTRTLTAKDTGGEAMFIIPSAGTWTVTAVDGDKTASKAVEITAEGQVEAIELSYYLVLFDHNDGGDNTAVTGGWVFSGGSTGKIENNYIILDTGSNTKDYGVSAGTVNTIDPNKYSKLEVLFSSISTGATATPSAIGLSTSNTSKKWIASTKFSQNLTETNYTAQVDISDVTEQSVYVLLSAYIYANSGSRAKLEISRVRLIP